MQVLIYLMIPRRQAKVDHGEVLQLQHPEAVEAIHSRPLRDGRLASSTSYNG